MKVRASVKKMCRNCKIVKREGVVRVLCYTTQLIYVLGILFEYPENGLFKIRIPN